MNTVLSFIKTIGMEMKQCLLHICDFRVKLSKYSQTVSAL